MLFLAWPRHGWRSVGICRYAGWEAQGLVASGRKRITLRDLHRLQDLADRAPDACMFPDGAEDAVSRGCRHRAIP